MSRLREKMEAIKKTKVKITKMKTTVSEIQNTLVGMNSTLHTAEEKISDLEYSNRNYQEKTGKKKMGKTTSVNYKTTLSSLTCN